MMVLLPVSVFAATAGQSQAIAQRQGVTQEMKDERTAMQEKAAQMRSEMQANVQDLRRKMQQQMEDLKAKRQAMGAEIRKQREDFMAAAKARRDALKKQLGIERAQRIESFFNQMVGKFEDAIDRLNGVADKIDTRLASSTANASDIAPLRDKLAAARVKITDAQSALTDAKGKYAEAVKNPDFKIAFQQVRTLIAGVAQKVKDAHRALVEVIAAIKAVGARGNNPPASSTPQ